jgi:hypothetical protein
MKPSMSMCVNKEHYLRELEKWSNDKPSLSNNKQFLVMNGATSKENCVFHGDMDEFSQHNPTTIWYGVTSWANLHKYTYFVEGTSEYDSVLELLFS